MSQRDSPSSKPKKRNLQSVQGPLETEKPKRDALILGPGAQENQSIQQPSGNKSTERASQLLCSCPENRSVKCLSKSK